MHTFDIILIGLAYATLCESMTPQVEQLYQLVPWNSPPMPYSGFPSVNARDGYGNLRRSADSNQLYLPQPIVAPQVYSVRDERQLGDLGNGSSVWTPALDSNVQIHAHHHILVMKKSVDVPPEAVERFSETSFQGGSAYVLSPHRKQNTHVEAIVVEQGVDLAQKKLPRTRKKPERKDVDALGTSKSEVDVHSVAVGPVIKKRQSTGAPGAKKKHSPKPTLEVISPALQVQDRPAELLTAISQKKLDPEDLNEHALTTEEDLSEEVVDSAGQLPKKTVPPNTFPEHVLADVDGLSKVKVTESKKGGHRDSLMSSMEHDISSLEDVQPAKVVGTNSRINSDGSQVLSIQTDLKVTDQLD